MGDDYSAHQAGDVSRHLLELRELERRLMRLEFDLDGSVSSVGISSRQKKTEAALELLAEEVKTLRIHLQLAKKFSKWAIIPLLISFTAMASDTTVAKFLSVLKAVKELL